MTGIYKITSPSNGIYIGQSWGIKDRVKSYSSASCKGQRRLYNSILKYGWKNHIFEIAHELPDDITQEVLDNYEIFYIQMYKDAGFKVLNIRGGGSRGKLSEETKEKIRKSRIGKPSWNKGKKRPPFSEEWKKNLSIANKGESNSFFGKRHSEKTKEIISTSRNSVKKAVIRISMDGEELEEYESISRASKIIGVDDICISRCISKPNRYKTAGGYKWKLKVT